VIRTVPSQREWLVLWPLAVRCNATMRVKYDALPAAGKPPKVALVAIMRKLLIVANALLRDGRTWTPTPA
jgi:transposase